MKVSVLIASKDRPDRLVEAIDAVLAQEFDGELEVIVKDGGQVPAPLPPDRRLFRIHGPDRSIPHAFNQAAAVAVGDVMHNANDDDLMLPGTIASAVDALATGAQWTYAWMRYRQLDDDGTYHEVLSDTTPWPWDPAEMMTTNCVHQPTVFYTRAAWLACGPFNEDFPYAYDYEFWGRLGARYEPVVRDHCDALYTFWPESTSIRIPEALAEDVRGIHAMWHEHGFGQR